MNKESILIELKRYIKENDISVLSTLVEKLEKNVREESSYKGNSKSKVSAIIRLCKSAGYLRPVLGGYHSREDGRVEFTDSYRAYIINKLDMPVEESVENYPNLNNVWVSYNEEENVILDIEDIYFKYKTRNKKANDFDNENLYDLKSKSYVVSVNIVYLKETIDILGKDIKCSLNGEYKPISFINKENEEAILLPVKKRG